MYVKEISFIERMLRMKCAYTVQIPDKGVYICMRNSKKTSASPIQYEEVNNNGKENVNHYVIWVPDSKDGIHSPWGQGRPSVNLYVFGFFEY